MRKIQLVLVALIVLILSAFKADHVITIYMIGDSTMSNKPLEGNNQERGWGHVLGSFFTEDVRVENHAMNGRSSKSFIDEGRWETVVNKIRPGPLDPAIWITMTTTTNAFPTSPKETVKV